MLKYILLTLLLLPLTQLSAQNLSGNISLEGRFFPEDPLQDVQHKSTFSLAVQPEYYFEFGGNTLFQISPFFRYDAHDDQRTHFDFRELYLETYFDRWELRAGLRKIFWGVTESAHLVDVINQTDLVENLDGEQKLGQPMLELNWIPDWGAVSFIWMPYFRNRTFPGEEGRLRFPFLIDKDDDPIYESGSEEWHSDFAVRISRTIGLVDIGLSHFYGTSREPRFQIGSNGRALPVYDLMHQTGLDLQLTTGGWLWKLEAISRETLGKRLPAFAGGFEYTLGNVRGSGLDIGLISEYLYDDRRERFAPPTLFDDDIFAGVRLAFNDVQSTEILGGVIFDRNDGSSFINLEASRRFGDRYKLILEGRAFGNVDSSNPIVFFRNDSYLKLELARYF